MKRALLYVASLGISHHRSASALGYPDDGTTDARPKTVTRPALPAHVRTRSRFWVSVYTAKPFVLIAAAIAPPALLHAAPAIWPAVMMLLLLAAQRHFQILVHDGAHGFFHHSRAINDGLCNALSAGWIGMSVEHYRHVHMQHHAHNGSVSDPEHVSFKTVQSEGGMLRMILSYALMFQTARLVQKYFASRLVAAEVQRSPITRIRNLWHIAACQVLLAVVMAASGVWWAYPIWLYLAVTFNPLLSRLRFLAEHPGDDDTTVTTLAPLLERFYFAPQNFNYHFEHHAWPTVPPYRLAALHRYLDESGYFEGRERNLSGGFLKSLMAQARHAKTARTYGAKERLKEIAVCPLCPDAGANLYWLYRDIEDYEYGIKRDSGYVECEACGLVQQWPRVSAAELPALYPSDYQAYAKPRKGPFRYLKAYLVRRAANKILASTNSPSPRVLEVGCGNGALLECVLATCPNATATGVDIKDLGLSAHPQIRFVEGQLEDVPLEDGAFDVIYCSNLIEHVREPLAFLRHIARLLAPDGRVIIETPNHLSFDRYVFGRRWGGYHYPRHTFLFNHHNIRRALAMAGLEVERLHGVYAYWAISINNCLYAESARRGRGMMFAGVTAAFLPLDVLLNLLRPHGSMTVIARRRLAK